MLSDLAVTVLKADKTLRWELASLIGKSIYTIDLYLKENEKFGPLTAWGLVKYISKKTELTPEQIVVEVEVKKPSKKRA